jgi:cytochrome c-type biogenesis protein
MMPGAIAADPLGVLAAFGAGILSFLSPCVLPLVPGYISMVSGLSAVELEEGRRSPPAGAGGDGAPGADRVTGPLLRGIGLFIGGFTIVFVALGAVASGLGHLLNAHRQLLPTIAGAVVVVLGLLLLLGGLPAGFWSRAGARISGRVGQATRERRFTVRPASLGLWAAPVMGMAFAFAWTPCLGPVLAAILGLAAVRSTLVGGVVLLFSYSLGLGVPFLVTGLAFGRLTSLFARARRTLWVVNLAAGGILVAFGILLLAGQLGWLSAQFTNLLNHLGLHRLTVS